MIRIQYKPYTNPERKLHKDILLSIHEIELQQIADSYYFQIDNLYTSKPESEDKVITILNILLNYWVEKIESSIVNQPFYLPFDYSDEYTGCLRIEKLENGSIKLDYGYTTLLTGWTTYPSKPRDFIISDNNYNPTTISTIFMMDEFISDINKSITVLKQQIKKS